MNKILELSKLPHRIRVSAPGSDSEYYSPKLMYPLNIQWEWCSKNLTGAYDLTLGVRGEGKRYWCFELESDKTAFLLRWA